MLEQLVEAIAEVHDEEVVIDACLQAIGEQTLRSTRDGGRTGGRSGPGRGGAVRRAQIAAFGVADLGGRDDGVSDLERSAGIALRLLFLTVAFHL